MTEVNITREDQWARQQVSSADINYDRWTEQKHLLQAWSACTSGHLFAVDVYAQKYTFTSDTFAHLFGYNLHQIRTIEKQGDLLEEKIHPEDHDHMIDRSIRHSQFIYSLPTEHRNDFRNIFRFRMRQANGQYIHMISHHQVLLTDRTGKAWIILGQMDISPDQMPAENFQYTCVHRKTGEIISPDTFRNSAHKLTNREKEILLLIRQGLLSKEIAVQLNLSIHTIHNHRKNILAKLDAHNAIEAIHQAGKA